MSSIGCPGQLTRDAAQPLMCAVSAIGGLIGDRQERDANSTRSFVFYTSATSLLLCLSPSGYGFPLPYLVVFCLYSLSLLLSGGHPCPRHLFHSTPHTERARGREGDGAKERISEDRK